MKIKQVLPTPHNVRNFVEGTLLHARRDIPPHQAEQVKYRMSLCQDCVKAGKCHSCPCSVPELFYAPNKTDAGGKWGPMLPIDQWEEFKKTEQYKNHDSRDTQRN